MAMDHFRTAATQAKYEALCAVHTISDETSCDLCAKPSLRDFENWRIVENSFPYDAIVEVHHMLIPKQHVKEPDLSDEERDELNEIKRGYVQEHYDFIVETTHRSKTVPHHYHPHLWRRHKDA